MKRDLLTGLLCGLVMGVISEYLLTSYDVEQLRQRVTEESKATETEVGGCEFAARNALADVDEMKGTTQACVGYLGQCISQLKQSYKVK